MSLECRARRGDYALDNETAVSIGNAVVEALNGLTADLETAVLGLRDELHLVAALIDESNGLKQRKGKRGKSESAGTDPAA